MEDFMLEQDDSRGRQIRREHSEIMSLVMDHLDHANKALVKLVFEDGVSPATIAAASGIASSGLYSRIRRIERRVAAPEIRVLLRTQESIPPDAQRLLIGHMIGGQSITQLAEANNWPTAWAYRTVSVYRKYFEEQVQREPLKRASA